MIVRLFQWWRSRKKALFAIYSFLLLWVMLVFLSLLRWVGMTLGAQGRLMFAAIPAISVLGGQGLGFWLEKIRGRMVFGLIAAFFAIWAAIVPFRYIRPAYARPPLLEKSQVPAGIHRLNWVYGEAICLIGVEIFPQAIRPGQELHVRAWWQLLKPVGRNYSVFVHVWGRGGVIPGEDTLVQVDTYPGLGAWPTEYIPPGGVVADEYIIPIPPSAEAPVALTVEMGAYEYLGPTQYLSLDGVDSHGNPVGIGVVGKVALISQLWPAFPPKDTRVECGLDPVSVAEIAKLW